MNIKFVRSTSEKFLIGVFSFFVFVSCGNGELKNANSNKFEINSLGKENLLLGQWEAEWETKSEAFPIGVDHKNLIMNGRIHFKEDGKVKIYAYGYSGCIFMSDTMINELHFYVHGDTVNLQAADDSFGLPYQILEAQDNLVKLVLMEDIALTLTR